MIRTWVMLGVVAGLPVVAATGLPVTRPVHEVAPAASKPCFPGAYYRKAVSSEDVWTGIEAVVVLPIFEPDGRRLHPRTGRPLDNASVYLGGSAHGTEIDCGLNWEVIREADGSVSAERKAYRPFWRNRQWHSGPARPELYFKPGDVVRLAVRVTARDRLTMTVHAIERGGATTREAPFEVEFDAPGFAPGGMQEFKRVNAIDQTGLEGKPVQATAARVSGLVWREVKLLRGEELRPMTAARFTDMRCPDARVITVEPVAGGDGSGERVTIDPGRGR